MAGSGRERRGCGRTLGCGCLLLLLVLAVAVVGAYWAYDQGKISTVDIYRLTQPVPVRVSVHNLHEGDVYFEWSYLDAKDEQPFNEDLELGAWDVAESFLPKPGQYLLEFGSQKGSSERGACKLTVKAGEQYQFVVLSSSIVVNRASNPSQERRDYVLSTCTFCQ